MLFLFVLSFLLDIGVPGVFFFCVIVVSVGAEIVVLGGSAVFGVSSDRLWFRILSDWLIYVNSALCLTSVMSVGGGGRRVVLSVDFRAF